MIVIRNGQLDTNGYSITTATDASAVIIFSGDNGTYTHAPTGGGTIDIAAPTSGPWSGVALYQDPALTSGVDISAAGNSPSWNITGLAYFPHASITFSGAVGKATSGKSCFVMVVDTMLINGTGIDPQSRRVRRRGPCDAEQPDTGSRKTGGLAMRKLFSTMKRLSAETSGMATIEFAIASTALTVGLLNGLEVARWSLQRMEMANAVHSATLAVVECL